MNNTKTNIALVGNPNSGKTSLFNALTGKSLRVGNWSGVTTYKASGDCKLNSGTVLINDLPGLKSLASYSLSLDVGVARDALFDQTADIIVNVVDGVDLERQLYLTSQLLSLGKPILVVISRDDLAKKQNVSINPEMFSKLLGLPVIVISTRDSSTIDALKEKLNEMVLQLKKRNPGSRYLKNLKQEKNKDRFAEFFLDQCPQSAQAAFSTLLLQIKQDLMGEDGRIFASFRNLPPLFLALLILEDPEYFLPEASDKTRVLYEQFCCAVSFDNHKGVDLLVAESRYRFAENVVKNAGIFKKRNESVWRKRVDHLLISEFGFFIFFGVIFLMFFVTVDLGSFVQDALDDGFDQYVLQKVSLLSTIWPDYEQWIMVLVSALSGVGAVISFLPLLAIMHLFLGFLEQSGYMARAVFSADQLMGHIGLHGKALIPMLLGFGCNVPAIEASRVLEAGRERRLLMIMNPFISCGARLPVYTLFSVVFFPQWSALMIFALYCIGIFVCIFTGWIMQKTFLIGERSPMMMDIPELSMPSLLELVCIMLMKTKMFVKRAGKLIFPIVMMMSILSMQLSSSSLIEDNALKTASDSPQSILEKKSGHHEQSILEQTGRFLVPLFEPMGLSSDNWPASVALLTGFVAKEVIIGTLDTVYSAMNQQNIANKKKISQSTAAEPVEGNSVTNQTKAAMLQLFDGKLGAFAYLLFVLLYSPCVTVMATIYKEDGIKWMLICSLWSTLLAYAFATGFYQIATWYEHPSFTLIWLTSTVATFLFALFLMRCYVTSKSLAVEKNNSDVMPIKWV